MAGYQEYRVVGVKYTLFPNQQTNSPAATAVTQTIAGSDSRVFIDALTPDNTFLGLVDYK